MRITRRQLRRIISEAMPKGGVPDVVGAVTGVYGEENRQQLEDLGDMYSDMHKELYGRRPKIPMFKTVEEAQAAVDELWQIYSEKNKEEDEMVRQDLERQELEKRIQELMPGDYDIEKPMRSGMGRRMESVQLRSIIREILSEAMLQNKVTLPNLNSSKVYILESGSASPRNSTTFHRLMKQKNAGLISESKAFMILERSARHELEMLLNEGIGDTIMSAYETVKGGAIKLKEKISSAALAAMEKVNDFLLKITLQAINLAADSIAGIKKAASMLSNAIEKFRDNHPILYKIVKVIIVMLIVYGIMRLFGATGGEAHAAVKMPGGGKMSQSHYESLRGMLGEYGAGDVDKMLQSGEAIKILDKAYKAKEAVPIEELNGMIRAGSNTVNGLVDSARDGDKTAFQLLMNWKKVGQNLTVN